MAMSLAAATSAISSAYAIALYAATEKAAPSANTAFLATPTAVTAN